MTTFSQHYRKDIRQPRRISIRLALVISGKGLTRHESHLIAEKELAEMNGYQYSGYERWP